MILIACIGIFCGCGIICHNFRRQPELSLSVEQLRRTPRTQSSSGSQTRNMANNSTNNSHALESQNPPLIRNESRSSKYDSLLFDDPPPKYEDAIKDYPSEIIVTPNNIQPQIAAIKS